MRYECGTRNESKVMTFTTEDRVQWVVYDDGV